MQKQSDMMLRIFLAMFRGVGIFLGFVAVFQLIIGELDAFFGLTFSAVIFFGLGYAGKKLILRKPEDPLPDMGKIAGMIFSGVGLIIALSSMVFFIDEDLEAGFFMFLFGSVFFGAGVLAYRVFRTPAGKKAVLLGERILNLQTERGRSGTSTSRHYIYVDKELPDASVKKMQREWAEKPWTRRKDWTAGKVIQEGAGNLWLLIGFTVLWNFIAVGISLFALASEWGTDSEPWFILVFPGIGIVLAVISIRSWRRRKKYGIGVLNLQEVPGRLGGRLKGVIETGIPADRQPEGGFKIRLVCLERRSQRGTNGERKVRETELWREEQQVYGSVSAESYTFALTVYFNIPDHLPPTEMIPENDRTLWRVEASASTPGIDYAARFEVPVFHSQE